MPLKCLNCLKVEREEIHQLDYQHSMLIDVPSEVFSFERTLEELYLDSNQIRDLPRPLFHCHELRILSITENKVQSLPPAIASLINLERLDLRDNGLTYIPDNIKGCKHLINVNVSINPLEKLPEGFTQLIALQELYLNDTSIEFLPANFGRLSKLRILELRKNNLNTLPKSISRLVHLQRLDIGQNVFSELPEVIGSLLELKELWIDFNQIRQIPNFIGNLKNLVHFDANNNNIVKISLSIGNCDKLIDLTLSSNEIEELPDSIGFLTNLITLKLDDNHLNKIPSSLGKLIYLEELILNQNDLINLTPSLGLLRKLNIINCDDNILEEIPSELGSCSSLKVLSIRGNNLKSIPDEIGHLVNLRMMNVSENQLQYLPVAILKLTKLTALWISTNQSTPLTTLQQEIDKTTGKIICTNFMFPQSTHSQRNKDIHLQEIHHPERVTDRIKPHIRFASDSENEIPSRLMRAPTPYPKELRAMAKNARFIHNCQYRPNKEEEENIPLLEELISPSHKQDIKIKEAKVKRPCSDQVISEDIHHHCLPDDICSPSINSSYSQSLVHKKDYIEYYENPSNSTYNYIIPCGDSESNGKDSHLDMETKNYLDENLRNDTFPNYTLKMDSEHSLNKKTPSNNSLEYTQNLNQINSISQSTINSSQDLKHKLNETSTGLPEPPPYHIAATYSKNALYQKAHNHYSAQEVKYSSLLLNSPIFNTKEEINQNNMNPLFDDKYSLLPNSNNNEESYKEHYKDETNPNLVKDSSMNSIKVNKKDIDRGYKIDSLKEHYEEINYHSDHINKEHSHHHQKMDPNFNDPSILTSLKTFTQDKPSTRNGIVMPTPQRPTSNLSKYNLSQNSLHEIYNHSNLDSLTTNSSVFPPNNHPSLQFQESPIIYSDLNPSNISPSNNSNYEYNISIGSTKINLNYESLQTGNHTYQEYSKDIEPFIDNKLISNYFDNSEMKKLYAIPCTATINHSLPDITQVSMNDDFQDVPNSSNQTNRQYINKSQELLGQHNISNEIDNENILNHNESLNNSQTTNSDASSNVFYANSNSPYCSNKSASFSDSDFKNKDTSLKQTWMFGLHKNPTVFPVTIKKNSRLGFTLLDELKNQGIQDLEGIFVGDVEENGPAYRILKKGDKILQINNIDITKLQQKEVLEILNRTGISINMMISRQQ